ncbi:MAG: M23 family metallopeptidase [Candidatus Promineifilaceae bacterium]|nr:M23 family metallopeptidase [Candidatus Promineifilaceae bacterium]
MARPTAHSSLLGIALLLALLSLVAAGPARGASDPAPRVLAASPYVLSDEQFISGTLRGEPAIATFLRVEDSFLLDLPLEPVVGKPVPAPEALAFLGEAYSVSPSLLLALAESRYGVLSAETAPVAHAALADWFRDSALALSRRFYDDYYGLTGDRVVWPNGQPFKIEAGNASTYALRAYFFTDVYTGGDPARTLAAWEEELLDIYYHTFGPRLAGRLISTRPGAAEAQARPYLRLPWMGGDSWRLTGGPHNFDGSDRFPLSGVDFQPTGYSGCNPPVARYRPVTASASGLVVGDQPHWLKLDHDGDGDPHTGWQTVYGHLDERLPAEGEWVYRGERLGAPSCHGGFASGIHVHFGVKHQNIWQPATDYTLSGWRVQNGDEAYHGTMIRAGHAERLSCFRPEEQSMDCTHAVLLSDNWPSRMWRPEMR